MRMTIRAKPVFLKCDSNGFMWSKCQEMGCTTVEEGLPGSFCQWQR